MESAYPVRPAQAGYALHGKLRAIVPPSLPSTMSHCRVILPGHPDPRVEHTDDLAKLGVRVWVLDENPVTGERSPLFSAGRAAREEAGEPGQLEGPLSLIKSKDFFWDQ